MKVFYGAAIQGNQDRKERVHIHRGLLGAIKGQGAKVLTEHTGADSKEDAHKMLEGSIGTLPPIGPERTSYVRNKMIELVESDIDAAVFELSVPSIGTGIEFAHAYLRPRLGLSEVPILVLYEKDFWSNGLSSMVCGVGNETARQLRINEYESLDGAKESVASFLEMLK